MAGGGRWGLAPRGGRRRGRHRGRQRVRHRARHRGLMTSGVGRLAKCLSGSASAASSTGRTRERSKPVCGIVTCEMSDSPSRACGTSSSSGT